MHFAKIVALSAIFSGAFAAPMPQEDTVVSIAGGRPPTTTTTTSIRPTTTAKTTKTTTVTSTSTATPTPTGLPKCVGGRLTFNIKARSLKPGPDFQKSKADGMFVTDVGGPAGFSTSPTTEYFLSESFLTQTGGSGKIATVKTTVEGAPHIGDIVFVEPRVSINNNWSPLRCTGADANQLACVANNNNRKVLQVCGQFINMDPVFNNNCQDEIVFDVVKTCQL
jgi:hypothetical protein